MKPEKFMTLKNKYEYLKIDCLEDVDPVEETSSWTITESRHESITITTAMQPDGFWIYGYVVYWGKGGVSSKLPTAEHGHFRSQREARLHAIGFMLVYLSHFRPETQDAVLSAEQSLMQVPLFD